MSQTLLFIVSALTCFVFAWSLLAWYSDQKAEEERRRLTETEKLKRRLGL